MNLIEESFKNKNEKKKSKVTTIILIFIILIILIIIGVSAYLVYIQNETLNVIFNGQVDEKFKELLVIEENGVVYLPIKEIASYFDCESYNGEYGKKSEEQSRCYIKGAHEIVNFTLGSNEMYKLDLESDNEIYEKIYINEPVKAINGILYASSDTIQKAFDISFEYNKQENEIYVYTIPYLVELYNSQVINYGYTEISDVFANQKALIDGIIIAKNDKEKYGVIDSNGNTILEAKYDDILFLENTEDFLVTDNSKKGILSKTKETKVQIIYNDIQLMDVESELYLVNKDNKYGVIDFNGNVKIYFENDQIGIDASSFENNDIKSRYILADNLIPVKKGKYWGLFNKKGKQIVDFKYDSIGYINTNSENQLSLLVIPDYNVIVAGKDKKYTLINSQGKELFGIVADSIYMMIDREEKYYYISYNNNQLNAVEFLESIGIRKTNSDNKTTENDSNNNSNNNEENNQQETTNNEENSQESDENQENEDNDNNSDNNQEDSQNDNEEASEEASEEQNDDEYSE